MRLSISWDLGSVGVSLMVLLRFEKSVIHRQIHIHDHDVGHRRGSLTLAEGFGHGIGVGWAALVEQEPQRLVHAAFSFLRGQKEDGQVVLDHAAGPLVLQQVVGHPEPAGGKHRIAVAVLLERPGLTHQPVDDVAVLDAMLAPASEPRQGVELPGPVPDVEGFRPNVNIHLFADQTAGQRVGVAADVDRAPGIDPGLEPASHLQPATRQ
jgi:hypothetical protein